MKQQLGEEAGTENALLFFNPQTCQRWGLLPMVCILHVAALAAAACASTCSIGNGGMCTDFPNH